MRALFLAASILSAGAAMAADMESAKDAQTLAAPPGKARVYLINGYMTAGSAPFDRQTDGKPDFVWSGKETSKTVFVYGGAAGVGALIGEAFKSPGPPPPSPTDFTRVKRKIGVADFYLDGKTVGK